MLEEKVTGLPKWGFRLFWEICWKLTKYWKTGLNCPGKMPTIFSRKLIKIIWDHQDVSCWCVHLTMVLFLLKGAWRQSYRSSKAWFQFILHKFMKMHVSIMKRCIGEKVLMKGHNDKNTQWFKYMMKELFKQKFEVEEICLINPK